MATASTTATSSVASAATSTAVMSATGTALSDVRGHPFGAIEVWLALSSRRFLQLAFATL